MSLTLIQWTMPDDPALALAMADVKAHLRVDSSDEDAGIAAMIIAAVNEAEHIMQRSVLPATWRLTLDAWPPLQAGAYPYQAQTIELRRGIVTGVTSIKYADPVTGAMTTLAESAYLVDKSSDFLARVAPAYGTTWPAARLQLGAVQVDFTCGWVDYASIPAPITQWIKLRVGAFFEHREAWSLGKPIHRNEWMDCLLDRYRLFIA